MTFRSFCRIASLSIAVALAHAAGAQTSSSPATQPTDPALKGPSIGQRQVSPRTTAAAGFGPDSIEKKKSAGKKPTPPPSMTQFMSALDVLRSSASPLTTEQSAKIQSINSDFESATKSYMDKDKAEIDSLRAQLTPTDRAMLDQQLARGGPIRLSKAGFGGKKRLAKQKGQDNAPSPTPSSPSATPGTTTSTSDAAAARTRLIEIYAGRPKAEDAQARILGALTGDQLTLVEARLTQLEPAAKGHGAHKRQRPATPATK